MGQISNQQTIAAADVIRGRRVSPYASCAPEVRLAGGEYVETPPDGAIRHGNLVSGFVWPAHSQFLALFLEIPGTRISLSFLGALNMTDRIVAEDALLLPGRRHVLLASLLVALPLGLSARRAEAINPAETQVTLPDQIKWTAWTAGPPSSAEMATLFGGLDKPGEYVVLMRWYPGYMSAPHSYATDRLCLVLSGTWWVNSGSDFDPDATVPVPAGGFVRRVAHTPHYDGVRKGAKEPVIIGIFGIAPVDLRLVDPSKPPWRLV